MMVEPTPSKADSEVRQMFMAELTSYLTDSFGMDEQSIDVVSEKFMKSHDKGIEKSNLDDLND
jgi:hypothetical protein